MGQGRRRITPCGLVALHMLCGATTATAQSIDRPNDTDDPTGLRIGRLLVTPSVRSSTRFDSNIFQEENNPTSDVITSLSPRLTVQGNWRVFALHLAAGGELGFYADSGNDDYQDMNLQAGGSLDLGPSSFDASLEYDRAHDPRGGKDVSSSATEPVIYRDITARFGGRYASNGLQYESQIALRRLEFDDSMARNGTVIQNDDRDRLEMRESLRVLVPFDPGRDAYGEVNFNQRQYDRIPDDTGRVRDSSGYQLLAGLRFDLTDLITADLAAGWMSQIYADPAFGNIGDYTLRGDFDWAVTRLTTLDFTLARAVRETTVTGASGILALDAGVGISHELRRWLQIGATAHYSAEDFQQTTRRDETTRLGVSLSYQLNRFARIDGAIDYDQRVSNSDDHDYQRFQSQISLKLEM